MEARRLIANQGILTDDYFIIKPLNLALTQYIKG
jgi:hypothetical protein